jgi:nifR3 family TIM-barrel protein
MVGLTHVVLRETIRFFSPPGLLWTEMCAARSLPGERPERSNVFCWDPQEADRLVCQIMGADPDEMARAAVRVEREGFFGVDLNMGCSVAAVCKQGAGAALLREPDRAAAVVRKVRRAVDCPVLVKMRSGWNDQGPSTADVARRLEDAGADGLVLHPRLAPDRRTRPPRWQDIARAKRAVDIPVIGNGNVFTREDAERMLEATGCDGIALGRIAAAKPFIFGRWLGRLDPSADQYASSARLMVQGLWSRFEPSRASKLYRKWLQYFAASFVFGHDLRSKLCSGGTENDMLANIEAHLRPCPETERRPNSLLFGN